MQYIHVYRWFVIIHDFVVYMHVMYNNTIEVNDNIMSLWYNYYVTHPC